MQKPLYILVPVMVIAALMFIFWEVPHNRTKPIEERPNHQENRRSTNMKMSDNDCDFSINGKCYNLPLEANGNSTVSIDSSGVLINGKPLEPIDPDKPRPIINVEIKGNVAIVKDVKSVYIGGDAGNVSTVSGDVTVEKNITGSAHSVSGNITAETINGGVSTVSGDINPKFK